MRLERFIHYPKQVALGKASPNCSLDSRRPERHQFAVFDHIFFTFFRHFGALAHNGLDREQSWLFGIMGSIGAILVAMISLFCILGLIGAYGFLKNKPYGKPILLVLSIISLFNFPFGTALGAYTLWAFFANEPTPHPPSPTL